MAKDKLDRVPPYMPLIWQDWMSSADVRTMSHNHKGIYIELLLLQWVYGDIPRSAWRLSQLLRSDYKVTVKFLSKYCHLLVCCQCGASWTPVNCQCGASEKTASVHNPKLVFLKNDVILGLPLGTTEPEPKTKPVPEVSNNNNGRQPEKEVPSAFEEFGEETEGAHA